MSSITCNQMGPSHWIAYVNGKYIADGHSEEDASAQARRILDTIDGAKAQESASQNAAFYESVDPSMRAVVKLIREECGLQIADHSVRGDRFCHVFAVVDPNVLTASCFKISTALWERGVPLVPVSRLGDGGVAIEGTFDVASGIALVQVLGLDDDGLEKCRK